MFSFGLHDKSICLALLVMPQKSEEPKNFLEDLRSEFPGLVIQIISGDAIYNPEHVKWVVRQSWLSKERGIMLAKRVELDILMRMAGSSQISEALYIAGAKKGDSHVVVGIGKGDELERMVLSVKKRHDILEFPNAAQTKVLERLGVGAKELDALGEGKESMLLAEKGMLELLEKL